MARYLRIAAAVFFALLALAFFALWVRSYCRLDMIHSPRLGEGYFGMASNRGVASCTRYHDPAANPTNWMLTSSYPIPADARWESGSPFAVVRMGIYSAVAVPHWFLVILSASLAALFAFKLPRRFTTRGLLIATTVVAGVLGLVVYAM